MKYQPAATGSGVYVFCQALKAYAPWRLDR